MAAPAFPWVLVLLLSTILAIATHACNSYIEVAGRIEFVAGVSSADHVTLEHQANQICEPGGSLRWPRRYKRRGA
jgi:hypothetical protein